MPRLPQVSGKDMVKVLYKLGFRVISQKGSHIKMMRFVSGRKQKVTVPNHKAIKRGTLKNILRHVNLNNNTLIDLLR